jgi:hypothetical protein
MAANPNSKRAGKDAGISTFKFIPVIPGGGKRNEAVIEFVGYIDSITTNSNPSWDQFFDMGRADPKVMYKSYSRSLQVSFYVVSEEKVQHEPPQTGGDLSNFNKLQRLGDLTLPIMKGGNGYNAPHIVFEIGKIISGYGYITSLDYTWDNATPWVDGRPVVTSVSIGIQILTDADGNRPKYNDGKYSFFGGTE